jgi:Flp pilus assembly protein TadD
LRIPVNLVLIAGLLFLGRVAWTATVESLFINRAKAAKTAADRRIALQKAFVAETRNAQTAYEIGEIDRRQSFRGGTDYRELAVSATNWHRRAITLNPFDPIAQVRLGMCLDWLDQHDEAGRAFDRAKALDPNGYFTLAHLGWHNVQIKDYPTAEKWLEQSLRLYAKNPVALNYLKIVQDAKQGQSGPK